MAPDPDRELRNQFLIAQFMKLREEIYNRTAIQQQLVTVSLLGAGATLTIGANGGVHLGIPVLLLYPVLVMFIAIAWSTQYATIRDMGAFIARLEEQAFVPQDAATTGWESVLQRGQFRRERQGALLSGWLDAKGIFLGIEVLSVGMAIARSGIEAAAFVHFAHHPEIVRPFLWTLSLGLIDLLAIGVTLSLPRAHPAMRRSVFRIVDTGGAGPVSHIQVDSPDRSA